MNHIELQLVHDFRRGIGQHEVLEEKDNIPILKLGSSAIVYAFYRDPCLLEDAIIDFVFVDLAVYCNFI